MGANSKRQPVTSPKGRTRAGAEAAQVVIQHRSRAERYAEGKALREACPRQAHAALDRAIRKGKVKAVFEEE